MNKKIIEKFKFILFTPLLIYLGERSLISYDEGYYALQARWILEKGNWIAPLWFDKVVLDRTIGVQFLIAISQKIFGTNFFAIFLPISIASVLMLYFTYLIHKELFDSKFALISPLILITTFLWINYANMASQDIFFATATTFGVFSSIKAYKSQKGIYFLSCGSWIGISFMFKTYLTCVPLLAIAPFLIQKKIIQNRKFWYGFFLGFLPFILWSVCILKTYGFEIYFGLFEKFLILSKKNIFTNPFYYYLWNLPLNIFPWTLLIIPGLISAFKTKETLTKYFLFFYPLSIILILSLFSTKTQYYPLQILSLFSINIYLGIISILEKRNKLNLLIKSINFKFLPLAILITLVFINLGIVDLNLSNNQTKIISIAFLSFSISLFSFNYLKNKKSKIISILLGPYILFILIFQSGFITDRTRDLRLASSNLIQSESLNKKYIKTVKSDVDDDISHSKIIKILLQMPNIGDGIESLNELKKDEYAWSKLSKNEFTNREDIILINNDDIFSPWKLVLKK